MVRVVVFIYSEKAGANMQRLKGLAEHIVVGYEDPVGVMVGICHNPLNRFTQYYKEGYSQSHLLDTSTDATRVEYGEAILIDYLKEVRETVSHKSIVLQNIKPGGEGKIRKFSPPYYVYLNVFFAGFRGTLVDRPYISSPEHLHV